MAWIKSDPKRMSTARKPRGNSSGFASRASQAREGAADEGLLASMTRSSDQPLPAEERDRQTPEIPGEIGRLMGRGAEPEESEEPMPPPSKRRFSAMGRSTPPMSFS